MTETWPGQPPERRGMPRETLAQRRARLLSLTPAEVEAMEWQLLEEQRSEALQGQFPMLLMDLVEQRYPKLVDLFRRHLRAQEWMGQE